MNNVLATAIVLVPLCPLIASCWILIWRRFSALWTIGGCGLSCLASSAVLAITATGSANQEQPLEIYRWVTLHGFRPLVITFAGQVDELAAFLLVPITFVATWIAVHRLRKPTDRPSSVRFPIALSLSLFAVVMVLLSTNLVTLMFFWQLLALAGYLAIGGQTQSVVAAKSARKLFLLSRLTDAFMAIAVFLIWWNLGSLDFAELFDGVGLIDELRGRNPAMVTVICLCLFASSAVRCAQFPLLGWLDGVAKDAASTNALLQCVGFMPAGVYLVLRCLPLFEASPEALLMMAFIGGFTAALTSVVALSKTDWRQSLGYSTSSHFGLMYLGLGTGQWMGISGALLLWVSHLLLKSALFLGCASAPTERSAGSQVHGPARFTRSVASAYGISILGALLLGSGIWGQSVVLSAVWETARRSMIAAAEVESRTRVLFAAAPATIWMILYWLGLLSVLLTAFGLLRAVFGAFSRSATRENRGEAVHAGLPVWSVLVLAAASLVVGPIIAGSTRLPDRFFGPAWVGTQVSATADPFAAALVLFPALVGFVAAWMVYAKSSRWPIKMAPLLEPFSRLGRNNFYLDDFCYLLFVLPVRGLAQLCRFFDWLVVDAFLSGVPVKTLRHATKAALPLQNGLVQFYALSVVLAAAVLLAAVTWVRG
jgi:NADH-quinone oxidoreductase subunit L